MQGDWARRRSTGKSRRKRSNGKWQKRERGVGGERMSVQQSRDEKGLLMGYGILRGEVYDRLSGISIIVLS